MIFKFIFPLIIVFTSSAKLIETELNIDSSFVGRVDEKFLSYSLDSVVIVGGKLWDSEPINYLHPKIIRYAKELGPSYLRVGGSDADKIFYDFKYNLNAPPAHFEYLMKAKHWNQLQSFIEQTNSDLMFTLSASPANRSKKYGLDDSQLRDFFEFYTQNPSNKEVIFEYGNEINGFWVIHGLNKQISSKTYAKEYDHVQKLMSEYKIESPLSGPSHAVWPVLGEPISKVAGSIKKFLNHSSDPNLLSWHYYPTQTTRCGLQTRKASIKSFFKLSTYLNVEKYLKKYKKLRDKYSPDAKLWLGETGPAQCGGVRGLTDRFISSLWWVNQLGLAALYDHEVVVRQTLIGADYALIDDKTLEPNPDYWTSLLWKKMMGPKVLKIYSNKKHLKGYAHCNSKKDGTLSLALINFSKEHSYKINFSFEESYHLNSLPTSKLIKVNNKTMSWVRFKKEGFVSKKPNNKTIAQPLSIVFLKSKEIFSECQKK